MNIGDLTPQWSYCGDTGPNHWATLSPHFSDCAGEKQSPIAISQALTKNEAHRLVFDYNAVDIQVRKVTANYQYDIHGDIGVQLDQTSYTLAQFHFHAHSEHCIDDSYYPLELHLIHRRNDEDIVVVAVMVEEGAHHQTVAHLCSLFRIAHHPAGEGEIIQDTISQFPVDTLLPTHKGYYRYAGSFTTPPCSEVVKWVVMKEAITMSPLQIEMFSHLLKDNYRPLQACNGRQVYHAE